MIGFERLDPLRVNALAGMLVFRPLFMGVTLVSSAILGAILLVYAFKGLVCIMNFLAEERG
jgi:hypothetical protein